MDKIKPAQVHKEEQARTRIIIGSVLLIISVTILLLLTGKIMAQDDYRLQSISEISADGQWFEMGNGSASGGGISANAGDSFSPSLYAGTSGTPKIAWQDRSGGDWEIYVRSWNGSAWVDLGSGSASGSGISANNQDSINPSLIVSHNSLPTVAWEDYSGGDGEIYLRRWSGSAWVELGAGSASGGGISANNGTSTDPALALGPGGTNYLAWSDNSNGDTEIYIRKWNGNAWVEMGAGSATGGGISVNSGGSEHPSVAVGPDNKAIVAWHDFSMSSGEIYVRRWNGSSWVEMGAGSASGGGISANSGGSQRPSLAISPDGTPIIAWEDKSSGDAEIYVKRWNGSSWVQMGSSSASGGGISANSGDSMRPSVAIGPDNMPVVSWSESLGSGREIHVRRWNGSSWVEMGAGSASGGGISNSGVISWDPSLAITYDGIPILAWEYDPAGDSEIHIKRWEAGNSPEEYTLTIYTEGLGTVNANPNQSTYPSGTTVTLTANPSSGWKFDGWSGALSGSSNPTSLIMNGDKSVTARFVRETEYTLSVMTDGLGTVDVNPNQNTYPSGTTITLTANPNAGWVFAGWSGNLTGSSNPVSLLMNGNKEVTAYFERGVESAVFLPVLLHDYYNFLDFAGPNEVEPNQNYRQANGRLRFAQTYLGSFPTVVDVDDYFYFYLPDPGYVQVTLQDIPRGQDYDLILRNQWLGTVAFPGKVGNEDEMISMGLSAGLYYIQINNFGGGSHSDLYSLKVTFE